MEKGPAILLLAIPFPFVTFLLPAVDGKPFFLYLMIFLYGFALMSDDRYRKALERNKWVALALAAAFTSINYAAWLTGVQLKDFSLPSVLLHLAGGFNTWFWLMALMGFGQKHLNVDNAALRYARNAAYPFYLLHQTVIVAIGFFVVQLKTATLLKFLIIVVGSMIARVGLYDLVVRRTNVIRFLFGMKWKARRDAPKTPQA